MGMRWPSASMPEEVSEVTDSTMRCGVAVASVVRMSEDNWPASTARSSVERRGAAVMLGSSL